MFALRGIIISLSVFAIVYCALSLAVCFCRRRVHRWLLRQPPRRVADLLFALRIAPLASAMLATFAFTAPSFILLEPRSIDEPIRPGLAALAIFGIGLAIFAFVNAASATLRASRSITSWTLGSEPYRTLTSVPAMSVPVLRIAQGIPPMTAVGIFRSKVLISATAEFVLTGNEMRAALNHEVAHIRRRDNLKKLLLRFAAFPGMRWLDAAWLDATEMAADDAAVRNAAEALDLASALIKLSRFSPGAAPMDLLASVVTGPMTIVSARIERLLDWNQARPVQKNSYPIAWACTAAVVAGGFIVVYGHLLARVHAATEWLIR